MINANIIPSSVASTATSGPATNNLFDYMAQQTLKDTQVSSLHDLGIKVMDGLDGYIDRVTSFPAKPEASSETQFIASDYVSSAQSSMAPNAIIDTSAFAGDKLDTVVESLSVMFDYAIETQLVVRGATQVSGVASTLIRGQ